MAKKKIIIDENKINDIIMKIVNDPGNSRLFNYCKIALRSSGENKKTQCFYILNNLDNWKHPDVKNIKNILKEYTK